MQSDRIGLLHRPAGPHARRHRTWRDAQCIFIKGNIHDSTDRFAYSRRDRDDRRRLQYGCRCGPGYLQGRQCHYELGGTGQVRRQPQLKDAPQATPSTRSPSRSLSMSTEIRACRSDAMGSFCTCVPCFAPILPTQKRRPTHVDRRLALPLSCRFIRLRLQSRERVAQFERGLRRVAALRHQQVNLVRNRLAQCTGRRHRRDQPVGVIREIERG